MNKRRRRGAVDVWVPNQWGLGLRAGQVTPPPTSDLEALRTAERYHASCVAVMMEDRHTWSISNPYGHRRPFHDKIRAQVALWRALRFVIEVLS